MSVFAVLTMTASVEKRRDFAVLTILGDASFEFAPVSANAIIRSECPAILDAVSFNSFLISAISVFYCRESDVSSGMAGKRLTVFGALA